MKYLSLNKPSSEKRVYQHEVKQNNLKRAFDLIRSGICTSRSELARVMQLSATAISSLTDELIRQNLVVETGPIHAETPGRRPMSLKLNESAKQIAVFSLYGQNVRYTLYNLALEILEDETFPYAGRISRGEERGEEYADLFAEILNEKSKFLDREILAAVCISFPGIYLTREHFFTARTALDTVIKESTLDHFTRAIGAPVFIANLSMCMAYAEKKLLDFQGEQADDLIFVNISRCVGSALIIDGNIYTGPDDTAGDIAHLRVGSAGRPCACGGKDCLHHYLNIDALLKDAQSACAAQQLPVPEDFPQMASQYGKNPAIDGVIRTAAQRLGDALAMMICISGIDRIVIGGPICELGHDFLEEVSLCLDERIYARRKSLHYAVTDIRADSIGIAQYLLDKTDVYLSE